MKNRSLPACICLLLIGITANATIRRVGFFANQIPNQDYFTFTTAYAAASNGDTVLVFPGRSIDLSTLNKKLIIIGTGNWLDPNTTPKGNANLQAFAGTPTSVGLQFQTGSAGSVVTGFNFQGSTCYIGADNITLRRNRDLAVTLSYNTNGSAGTPLTVNNLQLLENYKLGINDYTNGFTTTNINISNNLINFLILSNNSIYSGNISNNIWAYDGSGAVNGGASVMSNTNNISLAGGAWLFQNNILLSYTNISAASNFNYYLFSGETNTVFNYNVNVQSYNGSGWGTGSGNVTLTPANAALVFNGFPAIGSSSADARYQLTANSPAKMTNRPGSTIDAGMFAGTAPYKLSNIPAIPSIYLFTSPDGNNPTGNTIQFNVSTRGNN